MMRGRRKKAVLADKRNGRRKGEGRGAVMAGRNRFSDDTKEKERKE